jgi:hypothetical protein
VKFHQPFFTQPAFIWIGIAFFAILLFGCSGGAQPNTLATSTTSILIATETVGGPEAGFTLSPTLMVQPAADIPPTPVSLKASPTPDCTNGMQFVTDLTVPDGALVARGAQIDKRWQVKNTGTCNWDQRYSLVLIAGTELRLANKQALYPARSGTEAVIRMLLTSPMSPGVYTSAWQAFNPDGEPFGDVIYVQFQVN